MKADEFNAIMADIAQNLSDAPKVTSLLDKIRTDFTETQTELLTAQQEADKNKKAYEEAQKYNMQLFLERGVKSATQETTTQTETKVSVADLDLSNF